MSRGWWRRRCGQPYPYPNPTPKPNPKPNSVQVLSPTLTLALPLTQPSSRQPLPNPYQVERAEANIRKLNEAYEAVRTLL